MKKATLLIVMLLSIISISSCTPEARIDQIEPQSCCGDDGNLPPPPPFGGGN
ncbi:hypothetical protein [Aequorivita marisscotiae]|uniref:Lipoprotein n=1 Tax=Aequorivita marisscotiae TaxID=3040348 RepID=A0ABY8KUL0_9FLAO|nr:hypothetical protein [Aequorivita sp. Ant34-E75]WGF92648.1 hypothetical protein QCQ61_00305 [Aequorivita sp. Ant34-E75]